MGRLGTHAVYASPGGSPHQDARLASGCWPNSTGWARRPTGFLRKVLSCFLHLSSFPRLRLAQACLSLEYLEDRALPSAYTAASVSDLIADLNAANLKGGTNQIVLAAHTTFA